jgi:hypothetical protein
VYAKIVRTLTLATLAVVGIAQIQGSATAKTPAAGERRLEINNGASSVDELVGRFLEALRTRDKDNLRALRVTRDEYINVILAGSVPEGSALRQWPDDINEYWWSVLHTKSVYVEDNLLAGYGGQRFKLKKIDYRRGIGTYATHTAYKQLSLDVEDEVGVEHEIRIGSVAEVSGQFKFISFIRD